MKKTAVDWFEKNISKYISYHYDKAYEEHDEVTKIFEQAKAMEKEQIIDAHIEGQRVFDKHDHTQWTNDQAAKYYNKTYK